MFSSIPIHVHFAEELASPPFDRPRRVGLVYPTVAQRKGSSDRRISYDLFWRWSKLSNPLSILDSPTNPLSLPVPTAADVMDVAFRSPPQQVVVISSVKDQDCSIVDIFTALKETGHIYETPRALTQTKFSRALPPWNSEQSLPALYTPTSSESSYDTASTSNSKILSNVRYH